MVLLKIILSGLGNLIIIFSKNKIQGSSFLSQVFHSKICLPYPLVAMFIKYKLYKFHKALSYFFLSLFTCDNYNDGVF
jgi:hypothetical protein